MEMRSLFLYGEGMNEQDYPHTNTTSESLIDLTQDSENEKRIETADSALTAEQSKIELERKLILLLASSPRNPFSRRIWRLVTALAKSRVETDLRSMKKERESVSESETKDNVQTSTSEKMVETKFALAAKEVLLPILKLLLSREYRSYLQEYSKKYKELLELEAEAETEDASNT